MEAVEGHLRLWMDLLCVQASGSKLLCYVATVQSQKAIKLLGYDTIKCNYIPSNTIRCHVSMKYDLILAGTKYDLVHAGITCDVRLRITLARVHT